MLKTAITGLRVKALPCLILAISSLCLSMPGWAESHSFLMVSVQPNGKMVNAKQVRAQILIEAPLNWVWDTLTDYSELASVLPGYERTTVVRKGAENTDLDVAMKVSALLPTYHYQLRAQELPSSHQLRMTRISGDFKSLQAVYKLTPQNNGKSTLVSYNLSIDPGFVLPGSQAVIRANTERSLKALEKHVEQQYHKSEIGQR